MRPTLAIVFLAFCCCKTSAAAAQAAGEIELTAATGTPLRETTTRCPAWMSRRTSARLLRSSRCVIDLFLIPRA